MKPSILLVDDEPTTVLYYARHLRSAGYDVVEASNLSEARGAVAAKPVDAVLLDLHLPDGNGIDWIVELRDTFPELSIVVITGAGDITLAVDAMRRGADNFLTKPADLDEVDVFIRKSIEIGALRRRDASHRRLERHAEPFMGESAAMGTVQDLLTVAAENDAPVLFQGETGTGKGVMARWIHDRGRRREAPFVGVNCSTLGGDLLASELFGHAKGAFTSAVADRRGLVEAADGGTLFLDEIGDMDPAVQAQLLKVIEEKSYRRLGEVETRRSDFRLLCASNKDLQAEIPLGTFREDLFFRINVFPISLPPLRDRASDIPGFVQHLIRDLGAPDIQVQPEVMETLQAYPWPGNIRELRNIVERALLISRGGPLRLEFFPGLRPSDHPRVATDLSRYGSLEELETDYIRSVMTRSGGDAKETARVLGISRATLYRKLKRQGGPEDP